jgi:O-antigen/teichoic acid export membrane protein
MVASVGIQLASFVIVIVLGRLLGSEAYGLLALALVVIAFGELLVEDSGWGLALVQREELTPEHCNAVFWLLIGSSLVMTLVFVTIAPLFGALYREPMVIGLIWALTPTLLLGALSSVPHALLRREFRFGALAARAFVAVAGGGIVAIVMALGGWGVWSLAGFHLTQKILAVVVLWAAHPWRPGIKFSGRHVRELTGFSLALFGIHALVLTETAMMRFLLGFFFSLEVLGYFFMAQRVTRLMHQLLTVPTSRVALPTFAQVQADRERAKRLLRSGMRMLSLIAVPSYAGIIVLAPVALPLALGDKWIPAIPYLQLLALGGLIRPMITVQLAALRGLGMPGWSLGFEVANAVVLAVLLVGASPFGPLVMTAMVGLRPYLMLPLRAFILHRTIRFSMLRELGDAIPVYVAALVMGAVVLGWQRLALDELPIWLVLLGAVLIGGAAYLGMVALIARDLLRQVVDLAFALRGAPRRSPSA